MYVARKFYNDLVAVTRDARSRPLARVLHLSGRAKAPVFFEMDDSLIAERPGAALGSSPPASQVGLRASLAIRWM